MSSPSNLWLTFVPHFQVQRSFGRLLLPVHCTSLTRYLTHHSQYSRLGIWCPTLIICDVFDWSRVMGWVSFCFLSSNSCLASVLCTCFSCSELDEGSHISLTSMMSCLSVNDDVISVHSSQEVGFHLDLEDFLHGLLSMATELVRMHRVCCNDRNLLLYQIPLKSGHFIPH